MSRGLIEPAGELTKVELARLIQCARACRDEVWERKLQLGERELQHGNGTTREAILACDNDCFLLDSAISKLWNLLHPPAGR